MSSQRISNRTSFALVREELRAGRRVEVRVLGQSMLPFFRSGSRILLRPIQQEDIRVGAVVLAECPNGHFVVHRIYRLRGEEVILLGDGNIVGTETVRCEMLCGVVDCSSLHRFLARIWQWRPALRRWPLALLRRILPE